MKKRKGFTLVEVIVSILLTVMTVLVSHAGITSSMRITTESYRKRAAIHEAENIMKCLSTENIISALNLYALPNKGYTGLTLLGPIKNDEPTGADEKGKIYIFFDKNNTIIDSVLESDGEMKAAIFRRNTVAPPNGAVWWLCIDITEVEIGEFNGKETYKGAFKIRAEMLRGGALLYEATFEK